MIVAYHAIRDALKQDAEARRSPRGRVPHGHRQDRALLHGARRVPVIALITGASGGIGGDLTRELAKRRYDVILVARSTDMSISSPTK